MGDIELQIFADRLKELRLRRNLTQKDFAEKIGVTAAALSAYENNLKNPSVAVAKRIADAFHVSIDWLCGLTEKESYNEEFHTYADIIRTYVKLCDIEFALDEIIPGFLESSKVNFSFCFLDEKVPVCVLATLEKHISKFVKEWIEIRTLYKHNTIKKELYDLWLNDKIREYEIPIDHGLPFN